jgi:hypothetical protein
VIVTNPDAQTGSAAAFTVTAIVFPAPTVTSIAPVTALLGDTHINVVVTGTGFLNGILVSFGSGIAVNLVTFNSATQVTANISVAITATTLGVHDVTVVNPDLKAASLVNALLILPRSPAIASITPAQGAQASAVAVTILGSFFIEGLTVDFGAGTTVTRTIVSSSTRIDVVVSIASTATLGPRDVIVTNPGGQSATVTAGFAVLVQSVIPTTMDDLTPLKFMVEIPATVFDIPAASVLKRVSVDANTRSQNLMVSLVFDDGSTQPFFTTLNTPVRGQQEWAVSTTKKWLAVRIEHMGEGLVDLVEIFGVDVDVYVPTVTAALATAMKEVGK